MRIAVFTSVTGAYLPNARVLAKSVKHLHPEWSFYCLFNDLLPSQVSWQNEPFDAVIYAHELGIDNFRKWAFQYSVVEFCTATKGVASQLLFSRGYEAVLYLDPDTVLFDRLDDIVSCPDHHVLLTPHLTDIETNDDGIFSHEVAALKHGTFNLGFFFIRNSEQGNKYLDWWSDRILRFSHIDFQSGLFTDQKWVNLAPYMFEGVKVLVDKTLNVATWNIKNRYLTGDPLKQLLINGEPLKFYHFSGFGHDFAWANRELEIFSKDSPDLIELWKWYEAQLQSQAKSHQFDWHYAYFDDGTKITQLERHAWVKLSRSGEITFDPFSRNGAKILKRRMVYGNL